MRQEMITPLMLRRVRHRTNLMVILLAGSMFCLPRLLGGEPRISAIDVVLPFALLLAHLALSPIPWQWTGDDRFRADLGRGFLQALCVNILWIAALLAAFHVLGKHTQHDFPHASQRPAPQFSEPGPGMDGHRPPAPPMNLDFGPDPGPLPEPLPGPRPNHKPNHQPSPLLHGMGLGLINLAFAIVFGRVMAEKEATELKERKTAALLRQSQARALQNQLEPHVLYNALNSLAERVHEDPLGAEESIAQLADLYRLLTTHGNALQVSLREERVLVETYLEMEQMRLGERLNVHWDWPAWADDVKTPPLLLQPLVENAIRHGISPSDVGGEIWISCTREGERLELRVLNSGCPISNDAAQGARGVGLGNLEARLELWTEQSAHYQLVQQPDGRVLARIHWSPKAVA